MTETNDPAPLPHADAEQQALWQRLQDYRFGEADDALPVFVRRVAREARVSLAVAAQAIEEYRRFCFLACSGGEDVTPSALIDQVWHTHLTDTREYWQRFCPDVLQTTLHHRPGSGDTADAERHAAQYRATLARYRRHFGEPPAACWPAPAGERAAARADLDARRWASPRAPGKALWFWAALTLLLGWGLGTDNSAVSPLHWRGSSFIWLFLAGIGLAWALAARLRRAVRGLGQGRAATVVDHAELAFLAGGGERVADLQLGLLLSRGAVQLRPTLSTLSGRRRDPIPLLVVEGVAVPASLQRALQLVRANPTLQQALQALREDATPLRKALIGKRLLLGRGQAWCARLLGAAPPAALWAVGAMKIQIGLQLQRPIGFLVAAMVAVTLIVLGFLLTPPRRSVAGDQLLAQRDAAWRAGTHVSSDTPGTHLATPLALSGTGVLMATPWAEYHALRAPVVSGSGGGSGASGCTGGGGDGGGSSCGSSCSSGCGGCGGGGD